jgi:hypothetical protein
VKRWLCLALLGAWALAACGSTATTPSWFVRDYLGLPAGLAPYVPGTQLTDTVVWGTPGEMAVVTYGSSGCPKLPIRLDTPATSAITLTLSSGDPENGSTCTTDYAPTTSLIVAPATVDEGQQVTVTILDNGTRTAVVLPPRDEQGP